MTCKLFKAALSFTYAHKRHQHACASVPHLERRRWIATILLHTVKSKLPVKSGCLQIKSLHGDTSSTPTCLKEGDRIIRTIIWRQRKLEVAVTLSFTVCRNVTLKGVLLLKEKTDAQSASVAAAQQLLTVIGGDELGRNLPNSLAFDILRRTCACLRF